jgi:hypothetical protein
LPRGELPKRDGLVRLLGLLGGDLRDERWRFLPGGLRVLRGGHFFARAGRIGFGHLRDLRCGDSASRFGAKRLRALPRRLGLRVGGFVRGVGDLRGGPVLGGGGDSLFALRLRQLPAVGGDGQLRRVRGGKLLRRRGAFRGERFLRCGLVLASGRLGLP